MDIWLDLFAIGAVCAITAAVLGVLELCARAMDRRRDY